MTISLLAAARARRHTRNRTPGTIHLRCLTPDDGRHVTDLLKRMSPDSRYQRYFRPVHSFRPADIARFVTLSRDHVAVGAFDGPSLIGIAQSLRSSKQPDRAEVAGEVADLHHGRGVATRLVNELAELATDVGVTHFTATVLTDNRPVLALMRSLGWPTEATLDGAYAEVLLTLPAELALATAGRTAMDWDGGWQPRGAVVAS
ncbi:GNAT family N-acetyltransferase [Knoellia locipacati]|uniref:GNAT family N-acetyltransferase n=1 Tax=Knoellia locipacati TaxID=882824 RepID=UPI00384A69FE